MRTKKSLLLIPFVLFFLPDLSRATISLPSAIHDMSHHHATVRNDLIDPAAFQVTMRKLWEQHIILTRLYLVSTIQNFGDQDLVLQSLLQNQIDIGNAFKTFYGNEAGDQLSSLLTDHIKFAGEIISDLIASKTAEAGIAVTAWYSNADDLAMFLNNANPTNWHLSDLQTMLHAHLDLTSSEVKDEIAKDYIDSASVFTQISNQILSMADVLSSGVMKQFPGMFQGH